LDDAGVSLDHIRRFVRYENSDPQAQSYLIDVPVTAMTQRAGGNHECTRAHNPAWATPVVDEDLYRAAAPWLVTASQVVSLRIEECTSGKEMAAKGLYTARGMLKAMAFAVKTALKAAAARPLDAAGQLDGDSSPLFQRAPQGQLYCQSPVYSSAEFAVLVARVRSAQEADSATTALQNLTPITLRVDALLARRVEPLHALMKNVSAKCVVWCSVPRAYHL
jgi:hypothetical protein